MIRRISALLVITLFLGVGVVTAQPDHSNKDRVLKVMTRNMDAGSDFYYVLIAAQNPNSTQLDLLTAITQTYLEMRMSNLSQRADGISAEVEATRPDVVCLQEVTVLSTGSYLAPPT